MQWWGIGVPWNSSLMGGEILRMRWGVVMTWCEGRVSGSGMLCGEC